MNMKVDRPRGGKYIAIVHEMGIQDMVFMRRNWLVKLICFLQYVPFVHMYLIIIRPPRIAFQIPHPSNL